MTVGWDVPRYNRLSDVPGKYSVFQPIFIESMFQAYVRRVLSDSSLILNLRLSLLLTLTKNSSGGVIPVLLAFLSSNQLSTKTYLVCLNEILRILRTIFTVSKTLKCIFIADMIEPFKEHQHAVVVSRRSTALVNYLQLWIKTVNDFHSLHCLH